MILLIFLTTMLLSRNPFFKPPSKIDVLAYGLKPKPFLLAIQQNRPVVFQVNDIINDLFTIKDISKNSYILVDSYGNEYNYSFA
jgi:hypothetical protein